MTDEQIKLAFLWVSLMLTYLLGDVMRIFAGDFIAGEIDGFQVTQAMWLGMSMLMLIPILMIYLSITLSRITNRIANIGVSMFFFLFNMVGLPTYSSFFDQFLIAVGLGFNVLTIWHAWRWKND